VENTLFRLIQDADGDVERAEKGIVYIDEVDKIARKSENLSLTRDVSGEGVQQALLKILEGTVANVANHSGRKHPGEQYQQINTKDILFIVSGAFVGLDKIIQKREQSRRVGFESDLKTASETTDEILGKLQQDDLVQYGLIQEFIGRVPVVTAVSELTEDNLVKVLTEPKNSLVKQYKKMLQFDGVQLEFQDEAIKEIAKRAKSTNIGARGLRSIMEEILQPFMFEAPEDTAIKKLTITKEDVYSSYPLKKAG
jgi:ATP-dependent Clp protease ATP-binding subunit ClpX